MTPPIAMEALIERVHQHIRVKENGARAKAKFDTTAMLDKKTLAKVSTVGRKSHPDNNNHSGPLNDKDAKARKLKVRTAITTVFKKPIYRILSEIYDEPFVRWLAKLGEAQRGYDVRYRCTFHDEIVHRTENCTLLKQHLKELVVVGHLNRYIEGGARSTLQDRNMPDGIPIDGPPQGMINVIHGIIEPERVCELKGIIKKTEQMKEVLNVQLTVKKGKTKAKNVITFSDRDLPRLQNPHNDELVVTLRVKNFDIKRS
ncbi:uncharacterized protein LOC114315941 [Camellia sinensis]|uniref:uncharacterized protein LOC114315941 n=1 Tax=Camellia sinensis TaxID=4442 RepID=UPI001035B507|nr:uncharacterized protein LOC114315941 [Camellia sinensis]